ncbi:MAG: amidase family protein, partial [Pyrinomonadaceae bacterium]
GLKGARLGLVMQYTTRPETKAYFQPFIDAVRAAGATLVDVTFAPDYGKISDDRLNVLLYEFKADLNKYLSARGSKYRSLEELIKFNDDNKEKELPKFGQELFVQSQAKGDLTDKAYLDALAKIKKATREEGIDAVLAKDNLDALVGPTTGATWSIAAVAGYPYITVPLGLREIPASTNAAGTAVPASIQATGMGFFGRPFSEPQLIKYAYAFEQKTQGRVTPQFLPSFPKKA